MDSGVYCRPKNSNSAYNSIIIDRFNKIFGITESKESTENKMDSLEPSSYSTNLSEEEKWHCGANVRAPYVEDGKLYEAVVEKIFDGYAVVRYLGYENEDAVKLKDLRPSLGEESITEQIEKSKEEYFDEEEEEEESEDYTDGVEFQTNKIELNDNCHVALDKWIAGMRCRALYEPNEVVYEAVVQEVNAKQRKAVVVMCGYGIPYEVSFDDMYDTIPELRIKQERNATSQCASKTILKDEATSRPPVAIATSASNAEATTSSPNVYRNVSNCQGMMQPENENDALACLISSNYLSGYYSGYYDCLKKFKNLKK